MENIVRTIVDMDKRARARTEEAEAYLEKIDSQVAQRAEQMSILEQERARAEIARIQNDSKLKLEEQLERMRRRAQQIESSLEKTCGEKRDGWVEELVARALAD